MKPTKVAVRRTRRRRDCNYAGTQRSAVRPIGLFSRGATIVISPARVEAGFAESGSSAAERRLLSARHAAQRGAGHRQFQNVSPGGTIDPTNKSPHDLALALGRFRTKMVA